MSFKWYELRFRALSPLHIGYHKLGMVQRTRPYVPGRTLWGAVTNNLARFLAPSKTANYPKVGGFVHQGLRFTYLFPILKAIPTLEDLGPLAPWYSPELGYGVHPDTGKPALAAQEFERLFLYAAGQTAVAPESQTAQDASLHETEYLAHQVRYLENRPARPVHFLGYLGVGPDFPHQEQLWGAIRDLAVGGERSYGCGRLRLISHRELADGDSFFGWDAGTLLPGGLEISWCPGRPVPAHVRVHPRLQMKGDLEPLVGRDTNAQGFGQFVNPVSREFCWVPGSVTTAAQSFTIGPYGIWSLKEETRNDSPAFPSISGT